MKELLQKLALFFLILVLIKIPVFLFYEDDPMYRKSQFAKQEFNTVFVGSSRTKFAIVPAYFDLLTEQKTKSYNFGIDAGLPPQTFFWCEELMLESSSLKYVFFELSGGLNVSEGYVETWREFYFADYSRVLKYLNFKESMEYHDKLVAGFFRPSLTHTANRIDRNIPWENVFEGNELKKKAAILPEVLREKRGFNLLIENEKEDISAFDEFYWNRILRLIKIAESKQIHICFFIAPRIKSETELKMIQPIYRRLDRKYKSGAAHYDEIFYQDDTSSDDSHLNHKGAIEFSKYMAEVFKSQN